MATNPQISPSASVISSQTSARTAELLSNFKLTPATLMARIDPSWIAAKWLQYLSFKIAQAVARGNCGLLISAPPRHGKSLLSTIATPLWVMENFPHKNVVVSTYGEELSTDFSRQIRDLILQNQDILSVRLRPDAQRVTNILTTKGGGLKAVGLRGAITGRGADVFVLDDYIKEPKEAMSATYLEDLWTWYRTVARTRLEPGAVVIILATRWVKDDIHGRIMKKQRETGRKFFEYIELPAIYDGPEGTQDIIGRSPGDVLFPARYNQETILDIKTDLGTRWFNAMFQQRPDDDETAVINLKWFNKITRSQFETMREEWRERGDVVKWGRAWDMASTKEAGDFTAAPRGCYNKNQDIFVIDNMKRGQWSANKAELEFAQAVSQDARIDPKFLIGMEQEPGSSGKYSIRHFQEIARKAVRGSRVQEFPSTQSKLLNAQPWLAALEARNVYIVVETPDDLDVTEAEEHHGYVKTLFEELEKFPEVEHDDQTDGISILYKLLTGKAGLKASIGRNMDGTTMQLEETTQKDPITGVVRASLGEKRRTGVTFGRSYS